MESKTVVVLVCLFALGAKGAVDEKLMMENIEECKKKVNLDDKDLEAVMKADYSANNSKCFVTCLGEKIGYIQDEEFSERGAMTAIDVIMKNRSEAEKQKAEQIVSDCAKKFKSEPIKGCGIGPATAHCLAKGALEQGIITKEHVAKMQIN